MTGRIDAIPPTIRRLDRSNVVAYRALMLEAYASHPDAFTSSATERAALPVSWWEERLSPDTAAREVVLGAFESDRLVGVAGLEFETREKTRHRATLFGMYVRPDARDRGLGRALVDAALAEAGAHPRVIAVRLTVTEGNAAAESLYERCGFRRFGLEPMAIAVEGKLVAKVHMLRDLRE